MAALNLYRYAELFRSKDIKGVDLLSLDKDKLAVILSFISFILGFLPFFLINTRWTASLGRPWFGFMASNGSCREFFGFVEFPFDFILFFFARLFWSTCSVQSSSRLMPLQGARGCVGLIRWHSSLARRRQWDWRWLLCINTRRLCYKSPASR